MRNGYGVWADYYDSERGFVYGLVDGDGSQPGCTWRNVSPGWIVQVRVCERYVSCSAWRWTT